MKKRFVSKEMIDQFVAKLDTVKTRSDFQFLFLDSFPVSYVVPVSFYDKFFRLSEKFYAKTATGHDGRTNKTTKACGYNGILKEIEKRIEISRRTGKEMYVSDFLKHTDGESDFYDPDLKRAFEQKTGCGDFITDREATTFEKLVKICNRKRKLLYWEYNFEPKNENMIGKKSVNRFLSEEEQATAQERANPKKIGKQFPVHILIVASYKKFFDYLSLYPAGPETFFKLAKRATSATEHDESTGRWQFQTIKNSKSKIAFLEHFPTWCATGKTLAEMKEEEEETEEE